MRISHLSTIFFCAVLIFSIYSIPGNYGQSVFAHEAPKHEKCWAGGFGFGNWGGGGFNGPYDIIGFVEFFLVLALQLLALAFIASVILAPLGASIIGTVIPPIKAVFLGAKAISWLPGGLLAAFNCEPLLVPPPVTVAGTVHLDCTDESGFTFTSINTTRINTGSLSLRSPNATVTGTTANILGFFEPIIQAGEDPDKDRFLPVVYIYNPIGPLIGLLLLYLVSFSFDLIFYLIPGAETPDQKALKAGGKEVAKKLGVAFLKDILQSTLQNLAVSLLKSDIQIITAPGAQGNNPFSWKDEADHSLPNDAYTIHPFHPIVDGGVEDDEDVRTFQLGKNSIKYFSKAAKTDTAIFPFNVYDSEAPTITFINATGHVNKTITLEANAHYGFKVNSKTLPLIKLSSRVTDNCDLNPTFDYLGPNFFLLSSLKADQFAPWKTTDHPPVSYYALTNSDIKRVLDSEINSFTEDDYLPIRTAGFDPTQTIEFSTVKTKFSTARHLFSIATNAEINDLLANNTQKVPPISDTILGNLTDAITLEEIEILGSPKLDEETLTTIVVDDPLR